MIARDCLLMILCRHDTTYITHHGHVSGASLRRYAYTLGGLIAFTCRHLVNPVDGFAFPLTSSIIDASRSLLLALGATETDVSSIEDDGFQPDEPLPEYEDDEESMVHDPSAPDGDDEDGLDAPYSPRPANAVPSGDRPGNKVPRYCESVQPKLQRLLFELFSQLPTDEVQGRFFSPILRYLVLLSFDEHMSWLASGIITHFIAALLFSGRLVMFREMRRGLEHNSRMDYHT